MKAITATPEKIREVFTKQYIIPDFQRPYSWDREQSEKLWEDILDFHSTKTSNDEKYFLGNIVVNPACDNAPGAWEVVDGQQRLTTLVLLIKALHARAGTVTALAECLRVKDPLTSALTNDLRINSNVISEDREHLMDIVLHDAAQCPKCKLLENYRLFGEKINEWWLANGQESDALHKLILSLLDNIVLLPIHCDSEDDALTIFETINNRGMSLSDADIFKAKLYHNTPKERQGDFIAAWSALEDPDWLFRVLMHILRAENGDSGKEKAMRSFFTSKGTPLEKTEKVMNSLKVINEIAYGWLGSDQINSLWQIMETYPNYYWNFPLFVFLHKYGALDQETEAFVLPDHLSASFMGLLEATVKYFFIKGVVYNTVNAVRDTVYRVCVQIEAGGDYLSEYTANLKNDAVSFVSHVESNQLGRYQRGLVLLSAYLNPAQDKAAFSDFMSGRYDMEHILPKKWNHYDGWTDDTWAEHLNTLGNLIPLSKALNVAARNEFFNRKKEQYRQSTIQDALDLLAVPEWTPEAVQLMQAEKCRRLYRFFDIVDA